MCTTVIVGRLASTTGRVILGHNEDSGGRCMHQQFWVPGGSHSAGEFVEGEPGRARVLRRPSRSAPIGAICLHRPRLLL